MKKGGGRREGEAGGGAPGYVRSWTCRGPCDVSTARSLCPLAPWSSTSVVRECWHRGREREREREAKLSNRADELTRNR